jgi:hypothetical protein
MLRKPCAALFLAVLALAGSPDAGAQELFTPMYKAPYRAFTSYEMGVGFSQPTGADYALEGFYGIGRGRNDFGLGVAYINFANTSAVSVGGNFRTRVLQSSESFPLDGALTLGVGGLFGNGNSFFTVPVGLTLGRRVVLEGSNTSFVPYLMPTMVPTFGSGDSNVAFDLGLGVDVRLSRSLDVRVSGALGDADRRGIGVALAFVH